MKRKLLLICTLLCANVLFAQDFWVDSLKYRVTSWTQPEVKVYDANDSITTVNIPATVTYNGINYSVTSIGDYAFDHSWNLTSVTVPNTVTSIGERAFQSCSNLSSVNFFNSSLNYIGAGAFASCSSLSSINIPNSVTCIGSVAFAGCGSLTSIDIPNSVVSIEGQAFQYCRSLTSVTLPQNATISNSAFENTGSTISIDNIIYKSDYIPLTIVGNYTFNNTGIFLTFYLNGISYNNHEGNENLMVYWFEENISNNVIIPSNINFNENVYSITSIDSYAFSNCSILTSITIPNSITSIGEEAFLYCI